MAVRVGEIRPSQLMYTYGVGAIVDLPKLSVIVAGLDDWKVNPEYNKPINDSRLLQAVQFHLPSVHSLLAPPLVPETGIQPDPTDPAYYVGAPVVTFPRWMVCPHCRILAPLSSNLFQLDKKLHRMDEICYRHLSCNKAKNPEVIPARFLVACENGHLDDFPWVEFVHRDTTCSAPALSLIEYGPSGEARDLEVHCQTCNSRRRLSEAFGVENREKMPQCRGRRPHLRDYEHEACELKMRPIILGASNTWFPVALSTIGIPISAEIIMQLIEENWGALKAVTSIEIIRYLRTTGGLGRLSQYPDERILEAIQKRQKELSSGESRQTKPDLKLPEWKVFTEHPGELNSEEFRLRPVMVPKKYSDCMKQVVLVERLREITAMVGFTRVDAGGELTDPEMDIPTKTAPLTRGAPDWVPASEVRGEGIFLQFDERHMLDWLQRNDVKEGEGAFFEAHVRWRKARGIDPPEEGFPGMRYVLLHSFAHVLMRQLSLECGYSAASLRERIYSRPQTETQESMAGILIYTSAPDSEGTLGGLVSMGETASLELHIAQALENAQLCANDPLCAEHLPGAQGHTIHAAACHACMFVPETSCERGNRYLDRSTLVPTVERSGLNLFSIG